MNKDKKYMICSHCGKETNVEKYEVPTDEWDKWRCATCDGAFYGQEFINWIADRISPSTSDDTTGRFVLRELVQNADDVEADLIVLRFCKDALYVYNNGFGFRSSVEGGPGDFDRISRVLAKPKEKEFYTSGNFGSGFQTVYLFTNQPEVHSHGKSFRYDPTIPQKTPLDEDEKIPSPYIDSKDKKGAVFRFPWRTITNAIVEKQGRSFFIEERPWKRWDFKNRRELFQELREYLHDSILCCQHLKIIRLLWEDGAEKEGYQVERDFSLKFINNNGKIGDVIEGEGLGGEEINNWKYRTKESFRYYIGSDFVKDFKRKRMNICTIVDDKKDGLKLEACYRPNFEADSRNYEEYMEFLHSINARKKSDIHILIPLFPWEKRIKNYSRKTWSYSVIPLPKESGNNFTFSAHLFPKQTREAFELHQEPAKRQWLEKVLLSAAHLYIRTYEKYVTKVQKNEDYDNETKQKMILDYLPATKLSNWVNVSIEDSKTETEIDTDIFDEIFSQKILLFDNAWYAPFDYSPEKPENEAYSATVDFPRNETERWLLERMGFVTFSDAFLNHPRFKELTEFKERLKEKIIATDEKFAYCYGGSTLPEIKQSNGSFFNQNKDKDGRLVYGQRNIDKEFVDKLIQHCLIDIHSRILNNLPIIPNRNGILCRLEDLIKEPEGDFSRLTNVIPSNYYPHSDFIMMVKNLLKTIEKPEHLLEGMQENIKNLKDNESLVKLCYKWIDSSDRKLPDNINEYPLVLDDNNCLSKIDEIFWIPVHNYDLIKEFLEMENDKVRLVSKLIFQEFEDLICKKFYVRMFNFPKFIEKYYKKIEGDEEKRVKLQIAIVECILSGAEKGFWVEDELKNLRFLPVDGIFEIPPSTCIGLLEDKRINKFVKSIDKPIQKEIIKNEKYINILQKIGCGNLDKDFTGQIIRSIDGYAEENKNQDGICKLNEEAHRIISLCLNKLIKEENFGIYQGVLEKRIIPVCYRKSIILSTPPRWDQKGSGERRLEKYERDWPWVRPEIEYLDNNISLVWDSIHFLNLHDDFKEAERKIIDIFSIERLIAKDGTPRALMIHFLLPRAEPENSLFFYKALQKLLNVNLEDKEINKIKKGFLPYLKTYFKETAHETEVLNTKDKPILYDSDGKWKVPSSFALQIEQDIEVLEYYKLHSDFSEQNGWDKITLINLGVVDRLDFIKIKRAIQNLIHIQKSPENDRNLLNLLQIGLNGIGEKLEWDQLQDLKWIPTKDGTRKKPKDALIIINEGELIIGDIKLDSIIDDTSLNENEKLWSGFKPENFERLGIRNTPNFDELIKVWAHYQKGKKNPPKNLYNTLDSRFDEWKEKFINLEKSKILFFCEHEWVNPKFVVMESSEDVPDILKKRFYFTDKNERLLKWIRDELDKEGKPQISVVDALEILLGLSIEDMNQIWRFVVKRYKDIDSIIKEQYKDKMIFPYNGKCFPPKNILVAPRRGIALKHLGKFGDWLSIDKETIQHEIDTLISLGAQESFDDIVNNKSLLIDILKNIVTEIQSPEDDLWYDYVTILGILIKNKIKITDDSNLIPIMHKNRYVFRPLKKVVLRDESSLWELFKEEDRLNIFNPDKLIPDGYSATDLEDWLKECGSKNFDEILERKEEPDINSASQDEELTEKFKTIIDRLESIVQIKFEVKDSSIIRQKIETLRNSFIYRCKNITRRYAIEMKLHDGGAPILKEDTCPCYFDKSSSVVFLQSDLKNPYECLKNISEHDLYPGFLDIYRKLTWESAIDEAFAPVIFTQTQKVPINFNNNLKKLDEWWYQFIANKPDKSSFPTLEGDFWWPALGIDDGGDRSKRNEILAKSLMHDRKLMFNIFSMATMLSTNVSRTQIKKFIELLCKRGLSFSEIYETDEEKVLKKMIDDMFKDLNNESMTENIYPDLRRRMFDILLLRRAMRDQDIGDSILKMLQIHMEDGLSPEDFLITGRGYGIKPFMKGFKGMFTGQIYFLIRESVRLGLAKGWDEIAFHSPTPIQSLIANIGGDVVLYKDREHLAKSMTNTLHEYESLKEWYDIPFFIYNDEFCRQCRRGNVPEECNLECYQRL